TRLALFFGAGTSVVLLLSLALLYVALHRQLGSAVDADLSARSDDLLAGVQARDLTAVAGDPMAQLYAADGTVLASAVSVTGRTLLTPAQVRAVHGAKATTV